MLPINQFDGQRIYSLDVFRGLTIFLMVFVNEVAGVKNLPQAFYHVAREVDGMTMVDWVFAGFLFIVGMSIPFAINQRIQAGDNYLQLLRHILIRTLGLLVLGVFMVNSGSAHDESMLIPGSLWTLMIYPAAILIWNKYSDSVKPSPWLYRGIGIAILIALALMYRGGEQGDQGLTPKWWGILGLIGWAYLYASLIYLLSRGKTWILVGGVIFSIAIYAVGHMLISSEYSWLTWTRSSGGHATHTGIVLSGIVLSLIMFESRYRSAKVSNIRLAFAWAGFLFLAGYALRPVFQIGKIAATPSWGLYSSMFSTFGFLLLYWIIDIKKHIHWTKIFQPAGANPLLTYLIPFILWALYDMFDFYLFPRAWMNGIIGLSLCIVYAFFVLWLVTLLNKLKIKLQL